LRKGYRLRLLERIEYFFERNYYRWYGCPRGKHRMKMSGCVYCGKRV
jgi:hypothetical protein